MDDGTGGDDDEENADVEEDPEFASDTYNAAYIVMPTVSGKYTFAVAGEEDVDGKGKAQSFKFLYLAVPKRAVTAHPSMPLFADNNYEVRFTPGRLVNSNSYYDEIVDEHLCRIYLTKGERWVFETSGATQGQMMYVYDTKGNVVAQNETMGDGSYDSRVVWTATATGIHYVGVCDPTLDIADVPTGGEITLTARNTADFPSPDPWDPGDDAISGGTLLTPFPFTMKEAWAMDVDGTNAAGQAVFGMTTNRTPHVLDVVATNAAAAAEMGVASGPHRLAANDLADCFVIPCRAGCTYRLRAAFADEGEVSSNLTLTAKVYYYDAAGKRKVATTNGELSPVSAANEEDDDFWFRATANGPHYVRVSVAEGEGLDYPGYNLYSMVERAAVTTQKLVDDAGDGKRVTNTVAVATYNDIGYVTAESKGGIGSWFLNKESITYPSGAILGVTNASVTVKFAAVSGYKTPASETVAVPAWTEGSEPVRVEGRYVDVYDSQYVMSYTTKTVTKNGKKTTVKTANNSPATGDNTPAGAFAVAPAATAKTLNRTLWSDDPADHFSFTAVAGTYYDFAVASAASNITLVVSNATTGAVVEGTPMADGTGCEIVRALLEAGKSYVIVSHGDGEDKDATYALTFSKHTPGVVRFTNAKGSATTSFSAKEGAEYATLYVARTGTEGAARIRYATAAGTALPGEQYYPVTDGEVSWKAGDKAAKAIKVRLIPDEVAHWAASNLTFKVKIFPVDEYDLADGEYLAVTNAMSEATVTVVEASAKKPGTIQFASVGEGEDETPSRT